MLDIFGILAVPLGYVLQLIYYVLQNYGWTIIIFTVILRAALFPLTVSQQKSMAKQAAYQPMMKEIQKKWAKDKNRMNEEMMKFQQENNIKMNVGCLPMVINMLVILGMVQTIYRPLQYILHINQDKLSAAAEFLGLRANDYTAQSKIISAIKTDPQSLLDVLGSDAVEKIQNFNFDFLGLDLSRIPEINLSGEHIFYILMPVLAVVTMICSQLFTLMLTRRQNKANGTGTGMGTMLFTTVLMTVWIGYYTFTVPVAFSLYYIISNILSVFQTYFARKMYDPVKIKEDIIAEIEERKKAKKKAKQYNVIVEDEKDAGKTNVKTVSEAEYARIRLEKARLLDEQKYIEDEKDKKPQEDSSEKDVKAKNKDTNTNKTKDKNTNQDKKSNKKDDKVDKDAIIDDKEKKEQGEPVDEPETKDAEKEDKE